MPAMITPRMRQRPPDGFPWAADNGRFASPQDYSDERYLGWLEQMPAATCLFATAPDVLGDAAATLALSAPLYAAIRARGYRPALVAQDGLTAALVPWAELGCLFIGGSTAWKLSDHALRLIASAQARGIWTHIGRVNTRQRIRFAAAARVDSVDGTLLRYGRDINRPRLEAWLEDTRRQPALGLGASEENS